LLKEKVRRQVAHRPPDPGLARNDWNFQRGLLSSERIKREGFLNPEYVTTLLQDHLVNKKDNRKQLWTLLVWELWVSRYQPTV
jgi:hypothetical protein